MLGLRMGVHVSVRLRGPQSLAHCVELGRDQNQTTLVKYGWFKISDTHCSCVEILIQQQLQQQ